MTICKESCQQIQPLETISQKPHIAKFFKEIGWVEELGSGVRNIYKYNMIYSSAEPVFIEKDIFITIISLTNQATIQAFYFMT